MISAKDSTSLIKDTRETRSMAGYNTGLLIQEKSNYIVVYHSNEASQTKQINYSATTVSKLHQREVKFA